MLNTLNEEYALLSSYDYRLLQKHDESFSPDETAFRISEVHNYPNPLKRKTTFTYQLTLDADEAKITIIYRVGEAYPCFERYFRE